MDLDEITTFLKWYRRKKVLGMVLPPHYSFGIGGTFITSTNITDLQLIVLGVKRLSTAKLLALEAYFQMINEVNAREAPPAIPRPDVF